MPEIPRSLQPRPACCLCCRRSHQCVSLLAQFISTAEGTAMLLGLCCCISALHRELLSQSVRTGGEKEDLEAQKRAVCIGRTDGQGTQRWQTVQTAAAKGLGSTGGKASTGHDKPLLFHAPAITWFISLPTPHASPGLAEQSQLPPPLAVRTVHCSSREEPQRAKPALPAPFSFSASLPSPCIQALAISGVSWLHLLESGIFK